jgi:hypothetical protein
MCERDITVTVTNGRVNSSSSEVWLTHNASVCYWEVLFRKHAEDSERRKSTFISHFNPPLKNYIASGVTNPY